MTGDLESKRRIGYIHRWSRQCTKWTKWGYWATFSIFGRATQKL